MEFKLKLYKMKTKVNFFNFDISKDSELQEWNELKKDQKKQGRSHFHVYGDCNFSAIKGREFNIDESCLFGDQLNTIVEGDEKHGFRLHFFYSEVLPNKNIKKGYYLDLPLEYLNLLHNTLTCGYCGKKYDANKTDFDFCTSCIGGEYVEKKDFKLMFLVPIDEENKFNYSAVAPADWMNKVFFELQRDNRKKRQIKRHNTAIEKAKKEAAQDDHEHKIFMFLIENGLDVGNIIFYNHSKTLSFNWSSGQKITKEDFNWAVKLAENNILFTGIKLELKN